MSVAHVEAVVAAVTLNPALDNAVVGAGLLDAVKHGLAALAYSPAVLQALERVAAPLVDASQVGLQSAGTSTWLTMDTL